MTADLHSKQVSAIRSKLAARSANSKVSELKRLLKVKTGWKKKLVKRQLKTAKVVAKKANAANIKRSAAAKKAKIKLNRTFTRRYKGANKALKKLKKIAVVAAKKKAKAKKKATNAAKPKPKPSGACHKLFVKVTKTACAKKKGKKKAACLRKAGLQRAKCNKAALKKDAKSMAAKTAKKLVKKAHKTAARTAKKLTRIQKYKDVKAPAKKPSQQGIFRYGSLLYQVNKDGTRSWIKYPTKKCTHARTGVVPDQFPQSAKDYELGKKASAVACEGPSFNGVGNPRFYKSCECNGLKNKKGHGNRCGKFGFKFKWCYVNVKCKYGNTAISKEVPDAKVLVGCKASAPTILP